MEKIKAALLTGGAGAIGSATVRALSEDMPVFFTDIDETKGKEFEKTLRGENREAYFIKNDVHDPKDAARLAREIEKRGYKVKWLINNVGLNVEQKERGIFYDYTTEAWNRVCDTCLDGLYNMTREFIDSVKEEKGAVVNIGSVTGFYAPLRYQCAYNICKSFIHNITRCMAIDYGKWGVNVNCVIPGSVINPMIKELLYSSNEAREKMSKHIPLGYAGEPSYIANAVKYLLSEKAQYISGALLNVDGGWAAGYCADN